MLLATCINAMVCQYIKTYPYISMINLPNTNSPINLPFDSVMSREIFEHRKNYKNMLRNISTTHNVHYHDIKHEATDIIHMTNIPIRSRPTRSSSQKHTWSNDIFPHKSTHSILSTRGRIECGAHGFRSGVQRGEYIECVVLD